MKRKLFSVLLCAFALLLLMGAASAPDQAASILAEEESAAPGGQALSAEAEDAAEPASESEAEDEVPFWLRVKDRELADEAVEPAPAEESTAPVEESPAPVEEVPLVDNQLLVDGAGVSPEVGRFVEDGVTYVSLSAMARELDPSAQVEWDGQAQQTKVTTAKLTLTAQVGQLYLVANGRYFYLPETVRVIEGRMVVPLWAMAKAFDAAVGWQAETGTATVTRRSGAVQSGDGFYDQEDLFWLSRIIVAESGNQPLEGKMAVGNVVMNRVASSRYPNTVKEVLAQKNQFSPYKNGKLADRKPNESSVIAAKLVLDGGVVEETEGAMWFDGSRNSWAAKNKEFVATIGGHSFYR